MVKQGSWTKNRSQTNLQVGVYTHSWYSAVFVCFTCVYLRAAFCSLFFVHTTVFTDGFIYSWSCDWTSQFWTLFGLTSSETKQKNTVVDRLQLIVSLDFRPWWINVAPVSLIETLNLLTLYNHPDIIPKMQCNRPTVYSDYFEHTYFLHAFKNILSPVLLLVLE